jgi:hypothetical protein
MTETFTPRACPDCDQQTSLVHLGEGRPREVCGRFDCDWNGRTLEVSQ